MQTKFRLKFCAQLICILLIAAAVFGFSACAPQNDSVSSSSETSSLVNESEKTDIGGPYTELGQGKTKFNFKVTGLDGKVEEFLISTDKETVGAALQELNLIAGDQGDFGLYVKTVNGVTVDYDKDGKYWAFYIDGAYAPKGVDQTNIEAGKVYEFKAE